MRNARRCDSQGGDREFELERNATHRLTLNILNERLGARMVTSPVPIYLGCAGLIVGSLGLGAQYMLAGSSAPPTTAVQEQPLFARSVEEAAVPATPWPNQNPEVAFYEPMVELLTTPARTSEPSQPVASNPEEPPVAASREIVRDVPREQVRQSSRRAKNPRAKNEASGEPSDQRVARERGRQRAETQDEAEDRNVEPRRFGRQYQDRAESEPADVRSRSERGGQRVVIREETREPERYVRSPEQRESFGFSPFRLFGIFDQR